MKCLGKPFLLGSVVYGCILTVTTHGALLETLNAGECIVFGFSYYVSCSDIIYILLCCWCVCEINCINKGEYNIPGMSVEPISWDCNSEEPCFAFINDTSCNHSSTFKNHWTHLREINIQPSSIKHLCPNPAKDIAHLNSLLVPVACWIGDYGQNVWVEICIGGCRSSSLHCFAWGVALLIVSKNRTFCPKWGPQSLWQLYIAFVGLRKPSETDQSSASVRFRMTEIWVAQNHGWITLDFGICRDSWNRAICTFVHIASTLNKEFSVQLRIMTISGLTVVKMYKHVDCLLKSQNLKWGCGKDPRWIGEGLLSLAQQFPPPPM